MYIDLVILSLICIAASNYMTWRQCSKHSKESITKVVEQLQAEGLVDYAE